MKNESDLTNYKEATADKATDLYSTWHEMAAPVPGGSDTEPSCGKDEPDIPECHVEVLGKPLQQAGENNDSTELDRMIQDLLDQRRSVSGSSAKAVAASAPWTGSPMPPPPKKSSGSAQPARQLPQPAVPLPQPAVTTLQPGCTQKAMAPGPAPGQPVPIPPKMAAPVLKCPPPPAPGHEVPVIRGKASVRDDGRFYAAGLHYVHIFCCFDKFWGSIAIF